MHPLGILFCSRIIRLAARSDMLNILDVDRCIERMEIQDSKEGESLNCSDASRRQFRALTPDG